MDWSAFFTPLIPILLSSFSPLLTAVVKKGSEQAFGKLPNPVVPLVNGILGAIIAGIGTSMAGATPEVIALSPALGVAGAQIGKSVRDQLNRKQ